jgi:hypothetical protein
MKKIPFALALISLLSFPVFAQDNTPAFEIFGGYSLFDNSDGGETGHGIDIALEGSATNIFSIVGEFGFYDFKGGKVYTFMGGPRVSLRTEKLRPFAHILFGGAHIKADNSDWSDTNFSMASGGGFDVLINESFSIRPMQLEVLSVKWDEIWDNDLRYSAGAVLNF